MQVATWTVTILFIGPGKKLRSMALPDDYIASSPGLPPNRITPTPGLSQLIGANDHIQTVTKSMNSGLIVTSHVKITVAWLIICPGAHFDPLFTQFTHLPQKRYPG